MREVMLMLHFIGLTMGLGTGFAHAFLGSITGKMTVDEAIKFRLHSLVLSKMGHIGITLLLVSGFYLITPYWKVLSSMSLLIAKLSLVAVLILLISLIGIAAKKAKQGDAEVQLKKMELLGKFTLLVGIAIVILAVKVFR
jgi:uncharacterized membrane protein